MVCIYFIALFNYCSAELHWKSPNCAIIYCHSISLEDLVLIILESSYKARLQLATGKDWCQGSQISSEILLQEHCTLLSQILCYLYLNLAMSEHLNTMAFWYSRMHCGFWWGWGTRTVNGVQTKPCKPQEHTDSLRGISVFMSTL